MENFPSRFIKILDDIQKDFIWSRLQPKIKHSTPIGNYEAGGYTDVASKVNSLKVTWIRRLTDDDFIPGRSTLVNSSDPSVVLPSFTET